MTWKVGLTGGIGSGKTSLAQAFIAQGVPVFSADTISHELSQQGQAAYLKIVEHFGDAILRKDGEIDRAVLGNIVFNNSAQKYRLESILHPMIRERLHQAADAVDTPYCILDIPLLVNNRAELARVNRILVVTCETETRIARIKKRSQWSLEKIEAVIRQQLNDKTLIRAANDVLDNNGTIAELDAQVVALHHRYCTLSKAFIAQSSKG